MVSMNLVVLLTLSVSATDLTHRVVLPPASCGVPSCGFVCSEEIVQLDDECVECKVGKKGLFHRRQKSKHCPKKRIVTCVYEERIFDQPCQGCQPGRTDLIQGYDY